MIGSFVKIAILALLITVVVTVTGTILLLRQVRKPEKERKSPLFQPLHIEHPLTQEDWDAWDRDPWTEEWKNDWNRSEEENDEGEEKRA